MSKQAIKAKIKEAIIKNPHLEDIQKVSLFGSYLSETAKKDSDVDLLIEFTPKAKVGLFKFVQIKNDLEDQINKPIDLLTPEQLSEYFRDEVLNQAEIIYER
ncbi:MAG: nucleotidyltransferase domain-containing protein [Patescibacteria group bacterium]|nr:nucleotidyltransferase domain-containing protein [Patescibacteria group bacterium]